jgi:hypothetical protein
MWLKLLRSVVLTGGILNAGMAFVRALNRLSSFGRYTFASTIMHAQPFKYYVQNRPPSGDTQIPPINHTSRSTVRLFRLPLWGFFRLTVCRELTLGR